jgi:hypothetical protein
MTALQIIKMILILVFMAFIIRSQYLEQVERYKKRKP